MSQVPLHRMALAKATSAAQFEGQAGSPDAKLHAIRNMTRNVFLVGLSMCYVVPGVLTAGAMRGGSRLLALVESRLAVVFALGIRRGAFPVGIALSALIATASVSSGTHEAFVTTPDVAMMSSRSDTGGRMRSAYEEVFPTSSILAASKAASDPSAVDTAKSMNEVVRLHMRLMLLGRGSSKV